MRVYITNINGMAGAAQIGQNMVMDVASSLGYRELGIYAYNMQADSEIELNKRLDGILAGLHRGDVVVVQLPTWNSTAFDEKLLSRIRLFGVKLVIFIHDVVPLMFASNFYLMERVIAMYNQADVLIAPSQAMVDKLREHGLTTQKVVLQRMWDNPTELPMYPAHFERKIHFPGNPERFPFVREWRFDVPLHVYGTNEDLPEQVVKEAWRPNDELMMDLSRGGFGLVWMAEHDKDYMKLYCPYKLGTFLTAGIPVIVERGIANQDIIEENKLGLVVDSLEEAAELVKQLPEETYQQLVANVRGFNPLLRNGYFTRRLLIEAICAVYDNTEN